MAELSAEKIAQQAFDLGLLDDRQLQAVWANFGRRNVSGDEFVQYLLRHELITNFQFDRMLKDERAGYFYGDYKVLYLVAAGSFARVYRAVHKESGRIVALKVLRSRYSGDPMQTDHFCREGWVGVQLRHANIVPIHEVYSKGVTHFLVMDFIEGRNLREFLKVRKKLDAIEATRLIIDLASGLSYAAERGVWHRDLKLTNVLISSDGQAKLVDFGLAATDSSLTEDADGEAPSQRTIDYAGLERATGVRKDDPRSDIYFLGCIFYTMLVGKSPLFETRDRILRLSRSRFFDVIPIHHANPSVPRVVATVVNTAMQVEAERRYQTIGEMLVELTAAAARLAAGETEPCGSSDGAIAQGLDSVQREELAKAAAQLAAANRPKTVMFVEANSRMQDIFREELKKSGFRVLVTIDPNRAIDRFDETNRPADCLVISTKKLAESGIEAFIRCAQGEYTQKLPVMLLVDTAHVDLVEQVQPFVAEHRLVIPMPITMRKLEEILIKLIGAPTAKKAAATPAAKQQAAPAADPPAAPLETA